MLQFYFKTAYKDIVNTVGTFKAETGGVLLGSPQNFIVHKFIFDIKGRNFSYGYDPDVDFLNKVLKDEWDKNQLDFLGFIHSHPRGVENLSGDQGNGIGDQGYIKKIFEAMPTLNKLLVPIVYSTADGGIFKIFPYYALRDDIKSYRKAKIKIV